MKSYYNEIDPYAAAWLRNLIREGLIADGDVDERSIWDVHPSDVRGYTQCHFFAGIGGWSHALRLAGWPDNRPVWTGSCPCQPFSQAGKGLAFDDERHLWPAWHWLIQECRPGTVFGEQVDAAVGRSWLDLVSTDLEGIGYAIAPIVLPAASIGAPHGRHRLWFVADSKRTDLRSGRPGSAYPAQTGMQGAHEERERLWTDTRTGSTSVPGSMADSNSELHHGARNSGPGWWSESSDRRGISSMADPRGKQRERMADQQGPVVASQTERSKEGPDAERGWPVGYWDAVEWLACRDGKTRPTQPGLRPLAHGIPARVGRLRAYGNAIVPQVAAEVIKAFQTTLLK